MTPWRVVTLGTLLVALTVGCSRTGAKVDDTAALAAAADSERAANTGAIPPSAAVMTPPDTARAGSGTPKGQPGSGTAASPTPAPTPTVTPSETVITGKVVAGGLAASPATSLQIEGGKPTTLVGPLEPELRRLGGATIWAAGAPGAGAPNATFTVTRYEIVSIDGAKPNVGIVTDRGGESYLVAERDTFKLLAAAAELRTKAGAKVWIVGRTNGKELTVQSYGIIRER